MRLRGICLILASALGLSACEGVISTKPLFTSGARTLRPGLWAASEAGCAKPTDARVANWPKCATPIVVSGNTLAPPDQSAPPVTFVLSDDDPAIFQSLIVAEMKPGGPAPNNEPPHPPIYVYSRAQIDSATPITALTLTSLACPKHRVAGLIPPKRKPNEGGDRTCTALTPDAVLAAARLPKSELVPWSTKNTPMRMVWITDAPAIVAPAKAD